MVKIRIENINEEGVQELEGSFAWGAVQIEEDKMCAFATGRTNLKTLTMKMAETCVSTLLHMWGVTREDQSSELVKALFVATIEAVFDSERHDIEVVEKKIKKVEE